MRDLNPLILVYNRLRMVRRLAASMIALVLSASGMWFSVTGGAAVLQGCTENMCPMHHSSDETGAYCPMHAHQQDHDCACLEPAPSQNPIALFSSEPGIVENGSFLSVELVSTTVSLPPSHVPENASIQLTTPPPRIPLNKKLI